MNHLFTISGRVLKALQSVAADKTDSRYYLHGVHALRDRGGPLVLEATNGKILVRYIVHAPEGEAFDVILPPAKYTVKGEVVVAMDGEHLVVDRTYVQPLEGRYPECSNVVPEKPSGEPAHYDARQMAHLLEAITEICTAEWEESHADIILVPNGDRPGRIIVHGAPHIVSVIGPVRVA